ncbi:MAG: hypothetical protein Hyperionvirus5_108 [Hyperionvirus sp.]|uniref:Uncharacterized protein n=1 Tax=Hyperionvirus sp. TaxID=2487770 RepID=A0A3G5A8A9_9VIRU|nr:MAG: hypothetical protein Hyperionvirus5_108 [Hyperionvirus sp.]
MPKNNCKCNQYSCDDKNNVYCDSDGLELVLDNYSNFFAQYQLNDCECGRCSYDNDILFSQIENGIPQTLLFENNGYDIYNNINGIRTGSNPGDTLIAWFELHTDKHYIPLLAAANKNIINANAILLANKNIRLTAYGIQFLVPPNEPQPKYYVEYYFPRINGYGGEPETATFGVIVNRPGLPRKEYISEQPTPEPFDIATYRIRAPPIGEEGSPNNAFVNNTFVFIENVQIGPQIIVRPLHYQDNTGPSLVISVFIAA